MRIRKLDQYYTIWSELINQSIVEFDAFPIHSTADFSVWNKIN